MIYCKFSSCQCNYNNECHHTKVIVLNGTCETYGRVGPRYSTISWKPSEVPPVDATICMDIYCKWHRPLKWVAKNHDINKGFCDKEDIVLIRGKCNSKRVK